MAAFFEELISRALEGKKNGIMMMARYTTDIPATRTLMRIFTLRKGCNQIRLTYFHGPLSATS